MRAVNFNETKQKQEESRIHRAFKKLRKKFTKKKDVRYF